MVARLEVTIEGWTDGAPIPAKFAFCRPVQPGPIEMSDNRSPAIRWAKGPEGTKSYTILCVDPDVPSRPDNVNKEGMVVAADLPRVDFYHWVLIDIPATVLALEEGADADGITARGKAPGACAVGVRGVNNYTDWFAGDPDMGGDYGGYDGPCPPWNDELVHHYRFIVYALDVPRLQLSGKFGGPEVRQAIAGHVLAEGSWVGTYTLNPGLRAD
ncbi:MAG: YbhB/YbcL family Raf kinase inhibitor-like protein [Rhodospirillales bacterium]